jgi:microcystin-dependent protein
VITDFAGTVAPAGWLLCVGQTINRVTYAGLFTAIGTTYNVGGEAGTDFRLPDLRGRIAAGPDRAAAIGWVRRSRAAPYWGRPAGTDLPAGA